LEIFLSVWSVIVWLQDILNKCGIVFCYFGRMETLSYGEGKSSCNPKLFLFRRGSRNEAELLCVIVCSKKCTNEENADTRFIFG
jgi:hypothetical protein